jgi:hypothetical protein
MIEMLRIYSKDFWENVTIEELPPLIHAPGYAQSLRLHPIRRRSPGFLKATISLQKESSGSGLGYSDFVASIKKLAYSNAECAWLPTGRD